MNMISQIDADGAPQHNTVRGRFQRLGRGRRVALVVAPIAPGESPNRRSWRLPGSMIPVSDILGLPRSSRGRYG